MMCEKYLSFKFTKIYPTCVKKGLKDSEIICFLTLWRTDGGQMMHKITFFPLKNGHVGGND